MDKVFAQNNSTCTGFFTELGSYHTLEARSPKVEVNKSLNFKSQVHSFLRLSLQCQPF
jgi:hypothetical protein